MIYDSCCSGIKKVLIRECIRTDSSTLVLFGYVIVFIVCRKDMLVNDNLIYVIEFCLELTGIRFHAKLFDKKATYGIKRSIL